MGYEKPRIGITIRNPNTLELLELLNGEISAIQFEGEFIKIDVREGKNIDAESVLIQIVIPTKVLEKVQERFRIV